MRPHLNRWGTCDRVENVLLSGMPDVFYNIEGKVGWLETKVAKGDEVYFEKFQPNWMRRHVKQGLYRVFVVVYDKDEAVRLYHAQQFLNVTLYPSRDWLIARMSDASEPVVVIPAKGRDWEPFRQALIS